MTSWLTISRGTMPLIISIPHAGTEIPADIKGLRSTDLARHDADWHVDKLYAFATDLGATIVSTKLSRTVIDVNRDPSGISLYPGKATTGLCPDITFDGEPLYAGDAAPGVDEVTRRRSLYFKPYHNALSAEIARLRALNPAIVIYDAHSIRSHVPRLFEGELPQFNIGSFNGASCAPALTASIAGACSEHTCVVNGRFKGGWITRHYSDPAHGIHTVQMELAMRGYADESSVWPPPWDASRAASLQKILYTILIACLNFVKDVTYDPS